MLFITVRREGQDGGIWGRKERASDGERDREREGGGGRIQSKKGISHAIKK